MEDSTQHLWFRTAQHPWFRTAHQFIAAATGIVALPRIQPIVPGIAAFTVRRTEVDTEVVLVATDTVMDAAHPSGLAEEESV